MPSNRTNLLEQHGKMEEAPRSKSKFLSEVRIYRTDERASWTTRREHAKERRENVIRSQKRLRVWSACKQSHTTKSDTTRRFRSKSRSRCEERNFKSSTPTEPSSTPLPQYLLDRSNPTNAKALSSASTSNSSSPIARIGVRLLTSM
jgi:hypothetical protein